MSKLTKTKQSSQQPAHNNTAPTQQTHATHLRLRQQQAAATSTHAPWKTLLEITLTYLASHNITQLLIFLMLSMSCRVSVSVMCHILVIV